ncbi:hypothetical protein ARMSODRAFT_971149 [Armillaria solidipes]|uniref:Uncharacterized protein n=1 Tax=Armillaria solidipes TaxID=1076256 RepID=A0A2H3C027_9AGAR|nr:hypothetical protein ARMSODRAFT_971149 [Armillaria solidipes]
MVLHCSRCGHEYHGLDADASDLTNWDLARRNWPCSSGDHLLDENKKYWCFSDDNLLCANIHPLPPPDPVLKIHCVLTRTSFWHVPPMVFDFTIDIKASIFNQWLPVNFSFPRMSKVASLLLAWVNYVFSSPITAFTLNKTLHLEAVTSGVPAPPNFTCSLIYEEREPLCRNPASRVSLTQMAKKKSASRKIGRARVTENGTLILQPTAPPRLVGLLKRLRCAKDFYEDDASDPSTYPLNIVETTRTSSVNQTKDELLNGWSFSDNLYRVLLKGLSLARQRLQLLVAERRQKTISDDQTAERLKGLLVLCLASATMRKIEERTNANPHGFHFKMTRVRLAESDARGRVFSLHE